MKRKVTREQHMLNGARLRERNEEERREMTRKALFGPDYPAIREAESILRERSAVRDHPTCCNSSAAQDEN